MITDDEINSTLLSIGNLFYGFNTAIKDDNKFHTRFCGIINSLLTHPISLIISVGDIVINVRIKLS